METQSKATLASWAIGYAKTNSFTIYEKECPGEEYVRKTIAACEAYLAGDGKLQDVAAS